MRPGFAPVLALLACTEGPVSRPPPPVAHEAETPQVAARLQPPLRPARSFRFVGEETVLDRRESPVSLTASDGTGLELVALRADAVIEDPLAFTELRMTFENPADRVLEGHFRITLPQGASLSRFAMKIDDRWQEGEVVELQAARRAYEDFLHRRQDPALLEQGAGNEFAARVFPIPAKGRKEIVLSYSQDLARTREPYRIPLRGLPELGSFEARVRAGDRVVEQQRKRWLPDRDFELADVPRRAGLRADDLVVARLTPVATGEPDEISSLLVLFDSSASRALGYRDQVALLERVIAGVRGGAGDTVPLAVVAFDQDAQVVYEGSAGGFGPNEAARLVARRALGASDLTGALERAAALAGGRYGRMLLISDGVATAGAAEKDALRKLAEARVERLDAIVVGGIRDEETLARLTTGGLARDGAVIDGKLEMAAIGEKLTRTTRSNIKVSAAGAEWVWPETLDGVQAGDEVLVFASVPSGQRLVFDVGGDTVGVETQSLVDVERPLLARAAARARIASLTARREASEDKKQREDLRKQIIDLSLRSRVVSPFTAMLVLESEDDYRRFQIDRKALSDILSVGKEGLAVVDRQATGRAPLKGQARRPVAADKAEIAKDGYRATETSVAVEEAQPQDEGKMKKPDGIDADYGSSLADLAPAQAEPPPPPARGERNRDSAPHEIADDPIARPEPRPEPVEDRAKVSPYTGKLAKVMHLLDRKDVAGALALARGWHEEEPGDVMALVALGEAYERSGDAASAARAYGSLIDLFPARADLRRFAGERLERIAGEAARRLAIDTYRRAAEQRPDHPSSHRLLAFSLVKAGQYEEAFAVLEKALERSYPEGRFAGAREILAEDLGLVAAAWAAKVPAEKRTIAARLRKAGGTTETAPSIRFVLNWETDANDVDFHIYDGEGNHAYYEHKELASGGRLYADVTTGYGPECFTIRGNSRSYPYKLQAHYYSRGPMGYGMGKLQIIDHDGHGGLRFEERPFVVMQDQAFVELGSVKRKN